MNSRTKNYLRGRFGDYYSRTSISPPPEIEQREWAFIPWGKNIMKRHLDISDIGTPSKYLQKNQPQHAYYSSAYFHHPNHEEMAAKEWKRADLIFDLDADHLHDVNPAEMTHNEMLDRCKTELQKLLDFLRNDFSFEDMSIVFSGSRGYHVHVYDDWVKSLSSDKRAEIVDYLKGEQFNVNESHSVMPNANSSSAISKQQLIALSGGWYRIFTEEMQQMMEEFQQREKQTVLKELQEYDQIGEKKATAIYNGYTSTGLIAAGVLAPNIGAKKYLQKIEDEIKQERMAHVDEQVTTDINRLIRLPGSLHGGTALKTMRLSPDELTTFTPLSDAIPEIFMNHKISIKITTDNMTPVTMNGEKYSLESGIHTVPEYLGVYLMARDLAEKIQE